jgi:hypothetical protein
MNCLFVLMGILFCGWSRARDCLIMIASWLLQNTSPPVSASATEVTTDWIDLQGARIALLSLPYVECNEPR